MSSAPYYQSRRNVAADTYFSIMSLKKFAFYKGWTFSCSEYDSNMGFNISIKGKGLKEVHLLPYLMYDFSRHTYEVEEQDDKSLVIKFKLEGNPLADFHNEFKSYFWISMPYSVEEYCKKEKLLIEHTIDEIVNKVIKSRKRDHGFGQFREYAKIVKQYLKTKEENLKVVGVRNV